MLWQCLTILSIGLLLTISETNQIEISNSTDAHRLRQLEAVSEKWFLLFKQDSEDVEANKATGSGRSLNEPFLATWAEEGNLFRLSIPCPFESEPIQVILNKHSIPIVNETGGKEQLPLWQGKVANQNDSYASGYLDQNKVFNGLVHLKDNRILRFQTASNERNLSSMAQVTTEVLDKSKVTQLLGKAKKNKKNKYCHMNSPLLKTIADGLRNRHAKTVELAKEADKSVQKGSTKVPLNNSTDSKALPLKQSKEQGCKAPFETTRVCEINFMIDPALTLRYQKAVIGLEVLHTVYLLNRIVLSHIDINQDGCGPDIQIKSTDVIFLTENQMVAKHDPNGDLFMFEKFSESMNIAAGKACLTVFLFEMNPKPLSESSVAVPKMVSTFGGGACDTRLVETNLGKKYVNRIGLTLMNSWVLQAIVLGHQFMHSLGVSHDTDKTCGRKELLMDPFMKPYPEVSICTLSMLNKSMETHQLDCLVPSNEACGNFLVDLNEECDCGGDVKLCRAVDPCCNAFTCQFDAQCKETLDFRPLVRPKMNLTKEDMHDNQIRGRSLQLTDSNKPIKSKAKEKEPKPSRKGHFWVLLGIGLIGTVLLISIVVILNLRS
jgi:hypothetical protein